jgi:hypothetical protein
MASLQGVAEPDFSALPQNFDCVLRFAAYLGDADDHDLAIRINAGATGLLLSHCRSARAMLVSSATSVYRTHPIRTISIARAIHSVARGCPLCRPMRSRRSLRKRRHVSARERSTCP